MNAANAERLLKAREILSLIFESFSAERETRKGAAWRKLQHDLSTYADILILTGQITLPQMIDTMQKLEEYMGGSGEEDSGKDAAAIVGAWLRGEETLAEEFDVDKQPPVAAK